MRRIVGALVISAAVIVALAIRLVDAQPGVGFSKTAPLSGNGSSGSPLRITPCLSGSAYVSDGSAWSCTTLGDVAGVTAGSGLTGGATSGTANIDVGAGSGILVSADVVSVDSTYVQRRVSSSCTAGSSIRAIASDGSVTCETDDDTTGVSDGDKTDITVSTGGTVWNIDADTVTGSELNITATSCTNQYVTAIDSNGLGTCTSEVGDISSVVAGNGLINGGTTGAVTLDVACGAALTCNANDVALTLCAANQSLVMDGAGTIWGCYTPVTNGGGTQHYVARWTNASGTTLSTGQIYDDTSNEVKVGAGADAASRVDARLLVTENGDTGAYVRDSTSNQEIGIWTGGGGGFMGTTTGHDLYIARSTTAKIGLAGVGVELYDNTGITGTLAVSSTTNFNGTANTVGDADTDYLNSRGSFAVSGANVSTASANCTASGEAQSFTFSRSSGGSASCVIDLNRTLNSAPYCVVTASSNKVATYYVSASSTTQVTITSSDSIDANVWCPDRR